MRKILVVLLALLLGLGIATLPAASVASVSAADGEVALDEMDDGRSVALHGDQTLVISLDAIPSTGYRWEVAAVDEAILRQVGGIAFEPYADYDGAPARETLRFRAVGEGSTGLTLVYRRPWEDAAPLSAYSVDVQTEGPFTPIEEPAAGPPPSPSAKDLGPVTTAALPSSYNWCALGGCTPVKNQGACGSCWAFATVGVVESLIKIGDGVTRDLSEQYLVSCNTDGWNCLIGGGRAFDYFIDKIPPGEPDAGAVYEINFPYTAHDDPCNPPHPHHEKLGGWDYVGTTQYPSVAQIKQAIYDRGPVYVSICASGPVFNYYNGGIYETNESIYCDGGTDHAVVLVGWDDSQGASGVWYLRNSWGTGWGEPLTGAPAGKGYMRIGYGVSNVGRYPAYAVYGNLPPYAPSSPSPADGATGQGIDVDLSWTGGDPNVSDTVTYTVYFEAGDTTPDNVICNGVSSTSCDPGTLSYYTHYYWYVVATDQDGASTTGPVWDFSTESGAGPLVYDGHAIDDDSLGQSSGDGDGIAECGETIEIDVALYNQGLDAAADVTATFGSGDFYVTWLDGASNYPNISAGGTVTNSDGLVFEVHPLASDGRVVQFDLEADASNGGPWSDTFTLTLACDVEHPMQYLPLVIGEGSGSGVANGDFEGGRDGPWTQYATHPRDLIINSGFPGTVAPHSGSWAVWLGGAYSGISYVQQQVTVPPDRSYLAYYHWIDSADFCEYDFGGVAVNGAVVDVYDLCSSENTGGWVKHVVNLSSYAGQSVSLLIRATTDSSYDSNLFVDDVSFQSTAADEPEKGLFPVGPGSAVPRSGGIAPGSKR